MKKAILRKPIICILCVTLTIILSAVSASALGSASHRNAQPRHQVCEQLPDKAKEYYTGAYSYEKLRTLSGAKNTATSLSAMRDNELFSALHKLMADTHLCYTTYSGYQNGSLAYYWAKTDTIKGSGHYVMFYSDILSGDDVTMNREHIWPKSRASYYQKNGGADLHHLRPAVASLNNAKSDHTFGYINGTFSEGYRKGVINDTVLYYVSSQSDLFECKDDVKGDVARILLYVYCRWEQPNLYTSLSEEELPVFDSDDNKNSGKKVIEDLDTLLLWCENDPVDTWEMERNNLTEEVQGNRNVFIDYPELAWQLFSRDLPEGMSTPTHIGCHHQYEEASRENAGCETPGSFTLRCTLCGKEYQRAILPLGHLDKNKDHVCERCGEQIDGRRLILGDADCDQTVSVLDATAIQKKLASLLVPVFITEASDTDEDGVLTIIDATFIQKWLAKIPSNDKIGKPIG